MISIRSSSLQDTNEIVELYKLVAKETGGIARLAHEVSENYVKGFLSKSLENGLSFVLLDKDEIIGEIHTYNPGIHCFKHLFSDCTICISPKYQGMGYGKQLFRHLLDTIVSDRKDILRLELHARSTNTNAIAMYQSLGFEIESYPKGRVLEPDGSIVADVAMAWFNPEFINKNKSHL